LIPAKTAGKVRINRKIVRRSVELAAAPSLTDDAQRRIKKVAQALHRLRLGRKHSGLATGTIEMSWKI